jgi:hypothetical protein
MEAATVQSTPFTPFQIEMLELISRVTSEAEMRDIRRMLGQYFAKQAEDAIDRLWDEGILNDGVMEEWKKEHMRTPYKR